LAKFTREPASGDAAVVNSLIKKLRPYDSSYSSSSDRSTSTFAARPLARMRPIKAPMSSAAVWSCVGLGVLLGAALPQWPYAKACGWWLALYMAAVETVVVAGIWGARVSWKSRLGFAHVIAVCTIIWGLGLTAQEVLPRVGYAKVRLAWRCHDGHAALPSATRLAALEHPAGAGLAR
jgi:VIT1/CCC1 family predicted Fe2+/Mn2+ transporter